LSDSHIVPHGTKKLSSCIPLPSITERLQTVTISNTYLQLQASGMCILAWKVQAHASLGMFLMFYCAGAWSFQPWYQLNSRSTTSGETSLSDCKKSPETYYRSGKPKEAMQDYELTSPAYMLTRYAPNVPTSNMRCDGLGMWMVNIPTDPSSSRLDTFTAPKLQRYRSET
jgi:hypothetical protein